MTPTLSAKGRAELKSLLAADWISDWPSAEQAIRATLRLLGQTRPDVLELYFQPDFLSALRSQNARTQLNTMACALRIAVIELSGWPPVTNIEQARFYLRSMDTRAITAVQQWRDKNPKRLLTDSPIKPASAG
ncbi:MAG: hypothetical protein ACK4IT_10710 [Thioalkalivibrionaceae bacterium]